MPFGAALPSGQELWIAALSIMKCSEGGFTWGDILELDADEFTGLIDAAEALEKRISKAMK